VDRKPRIRLPRQGWLTPTRPLTTSPTAGIGPGLRTSSVRWPASAVRLCSCWWHRPARGSSRQTRLRRRRGRALVRESLSPQAYAGRALRRPAHF